MNAVSEAMEDLIVPGAAQGMDSGVSSGQCHQVDRPFHLQQARHQDHLMAIITVMVDMDITLKRNRKNR